MTIIDHEWVRSHIQKLKVLRVRKLNHLIHIKKVVFIKVRYQPEFQREIREVAQKYFGIEGEVVRDSQNVNKLLDIKKVDDNWLGRSTAEIRLQKQLTI